MVNIQIHLDRREWEVLLKSTPHTKFQDYVWINVNIEERVSFLSWPEFGLRAVRNSTTGAGVTLTA